LSIRAEVLDGGQIEISYYDREGSLCKQRYSTHSPECAVLVFKNWLFQEVQEEKQGRFISQQTIEARKAYRDLEARSPHNGKK
jgi:hypothetical protein